MALEIGQDAPDFTLRNEDNEEVSLAALRGTPVVLVFYPFDFSGTCTAEHCNIRDNFSEWLDCGAHVFGISRDSRFAHKAFKEANGFRHSLLADLDGAVARQYEAWNPGGWANRRTIVINRDGKVAHSEAVEMGEQRDHAQVAAAFA